MASNLTLSSPSSPARPSSHGGSSRTRCLCSPTTHSGSFRCSLHRNSRGKLSTRTASGQYSSASRGDLRESGGGVKAKDLREVLMQIMGPSRNNVDRRRNFQPRPTRFCVMNGSGGRGVAVA